MGLTIMAQNNNNICNTCENRIICKYCSKFNEIVTVVRDANEGETAPFKLTCTYHRPTTAENTWHPCVGKEEYPVLRWVDTSSFANSTSPKVE